MAKVMRGVKNVTKGYSSVQVKVRNATSNDAWGPTGTEMSEIAQMTFNGSNDFYEIVDMLDKRLNDKGKNWRHVLKSLKVLDYCLHEGSELVVTWARKNIYIIKTLREFQYLDDEGRDVGQNIRVSAKELTSLIIDEERLRNERKDRKTWKSRVTGIEEYGPRGSDYPEGDGLPPRSSRKAERRAPRTEEEDLEMKLALEASMNEAEEDKKRRQSKLGGGDDDADLAKALKLSKEEEELRRRELEESNAQSLFDDTPAPSTQPQYTGFNQGYQQQGAVDWFGNPVEPQQPQSTGYLNNAYSQFQPQQTGFQNGFQPQQTGFDQFGQPQANFMQPQQTIQPQQTAFNGANPYAQQQLADFAQFQPQQQQSPVAGNHNPWATNQPPAADALKPAPTGSNNPFASGFGRPQPQQQKPIIPTLSSLAEERASNQFNQPSYNPITNFSAPQPPQQPQQIQPPKEELDPQRARLNALLASGTGMDTFGNTGEMRVPSHFTAGGNFVNSAGSNLNKMTSQATGNNPFFTQKFTGAPQQHPGFGQPQNTGFGGGFGQTNNNPFGAQGGQQRPQQGGSLIDL